MQRLSDPGPEVTALHPPAKTLTPATDKVRLASSEGLSNPQRNSPEEWKCRHQGEQKNEVEAGGSRGQGRHQHQEGCTGGKEGDSGGDGANI